MNFDKCKIRSSDIFNIISHIFHSKIFNPVFVQNVKHHVENNKLYIEFEYWDMDLDIGIYSQPLTLYNIIIDSNGKPYINTTDYRMFNKLNLDRYIKEV